MTHEEIAKLKALAQLLDEWPTSDKTAIGYHVDTVAIIDLTRKDDFSLYVHEPVVL